MKKNTRKKKIKTDEWNERSTNLEEAKTKEEDRDWNKKNDEDEEMGKDDGFHEENYDT